MASKSNVLDLPPVQSLDTAAVLDEMIRFENVSKIFDSRGEHVQALKDVNLCVARGDIFDVVGYSGAGKSTPLRTINGLEIPSTGKVLVDGADIGSLNGKQLSEARQNIGMIFQQFNLLLSRNIFHNIAYPLRLAGVSKAETKKRVYELLDFVGLSDKAKAYPEQLSGGQKQRVGIARALANRSAVLICDEATSALDPQTTGEVLDLLKKVNREYGITILLITHEMDVIRKICNKVAVMEGGTVVEHGGVYDVFSDPQAPVTRRFVSSVLDHHPGSEAIEHIRKTHRGQLVQIEVKDGGSSDPFLSRIARNHNVDFNIVYGGVNELQSRVFGSLTVELLGSDQDIELALDDLAKVAEIRKAD